jgi:hypothetical protein
MINKEDVRPFYVELLVCFRGVSVLEDDTAIVRKTDWKQYNDVLIKLDKVTRLDYYKRYAITKDDLDSYWLKPSSLRACTYLHKLCCIITILYEVYFSDETPPFADMPTTIITQTQNQSLQVQLLLEVNDLIHKKLSTVPEGSKEKTFLEKIKVSLSSVKDVSQLVSLLVTTAQQLGITIEQLKTLFS